jgi:hypothetical protein
MFYSPTLHDSFRSWPRETDAPLRALEGNGGSS